MYDFIPDWYRVDWCMDRRHIGWTYELLVRMRPERTLEIGSYSGCSSSAFVAAEIPDGHFADPYPQGDFYKVVKGNGTIHRRKGCDVVDEEEPFEVILVDGAHDLGSVTEELDAILAKPPRVVIAHDINSTNAGYDQCEGARYLHEKLRNLGWHCVVDTKDREGERTNRGMMIATTDVGLLPIIEDAKDAAGCN